MMFDVIFYLEIRERIHVIKTRLVKDMDIVWFLVLNAKDEFATLETCSIASIVSVDNL
jgi:hypothetical protein